MSFDAEVKPRGCDHHACTEDGEFRAPRSPNSLSSYYWFCLDHVRAYNASWNYFSDMSEQEIEKFRREAVTGHRPTWKMGSGQQINDPDAVLDPFRIFKAAGIFDGGREPAREPYVDPKCRRAFAVLNLETNASLQEVKMRYKQLVKRYHPDANGGDKAAEERFKSISEAYQFLQSNGAW